MSDTRKSLNQLVSQKLKTRDERLADVQSLNDRGIILSDYKIYFDAANEVAAAAGLSEGDTRALVAAARANDAEITLVEMRMSLDEALIEQA
jgi:hypothetical protein